MDDQSTMKKTARVSMEDDVLSRLPDQILDRILCFLPQKDSVRTCVLSKSWRHLGSSRSKLELCLITDFNRDIEKFMSVMYNTLQRYHRQNLFLKQLSLKSYNTSTVLLDLPSVASKAESLFKHLRKLSLFLVSVKDENLESMMSSTCPLIEWLSITYSTGFTNLNVGKALTYLKHYELSHNVLSSIQVNAPTLETICIRERGLKWCFIDNNNYFPRLKSLCLTSVRLSSDMFRFFASDYMPSLEKLELESCLCKEFKLSSSSIKYLSIVDFSGATKVMIDAPNVTCFKLREYIPVPLISFTPISSEWESHLYLLCFRRNTFPGIHEIHQLLKSLDQSKITLKLYFCKDYMRRVADTTNYHDVLYHHKPVVVEGLSLELLICSYSGVQVIVDYLFRVCRPRYIYDARTQYSCRELTEILWKLLLHEREKRDYSWYPDLEEVGMESASSCDINPKEWHSVPAGNSLSELENRNIRFRLKWRAV